MGGTLKQLGEQDMNFVNTFLYRWLAPARENNSADYNVLLGLVYFLERFSCYIEGHSFIILTGDQVLKRFSIKPDKSRREAR